jgi:hypothetical protein
MMESPEINALEEQLDRAEQEVATLVAGLTEE